jgi:transcriptional regulator with XRE-family HTH domain
MRQRTGPAITHPRLRATAATRRAGSRADYLASRVGTGLRDARLAQGLRQVDVAAEARISQGHYSRIERGREPGVALDTLAACASALNVQLAAFIEALPGASLPRDIEHLRRQAMVVELALRGGWQAVPEFALPGDGPRPRSIDVLIARPVRHEAAVVEIWDLLLDGGDAIRGLEAKVAATRDRLGDSWHVQGLILLRRTKRNLGLIRDLAPLFAARYPASSGSWIRALIDPRSPMPDGPGFAWTSVTGERLIAARLR